MQTKSNEGPLWISFPANNHVLIALFFKKKKIIIRNGGLSSNVLSVLCMVNIYSA